MKKYLIMMYQEGATHVESVFRLGSDYALTRMATDANEISKALHKTDCKVFACDVYNKGRGVIDENLSPDITLVKTEDLENLIKQGLDGVILSGIHAMNGAQNSFFSYSVNEVAWFKYKFNNVEMGDIGVAATYFGYFNVPVIAVLGDEGACNEAKSLLQGVATIPVKVAKIRNMCHCYEFAEVSKNIDETFAQVLAKPFIAPLKFQPPFRVEVLFARVDYCDDCIKYNYGRVTRLSPLVAFREFDEIHAYNDMRI